MEGGLASDTRRKLFEKLKELEAIAEGLEDEQMRELIDHGAKIKSKQEEWGVDKALLENKHRDDMKRLQADVGRLQEEIENMKGRVEGLKERIQDQEKEAKKRCGGGQANLPTKEAVVVSFQLVHEQAKTAFFNIGKFVHDGRLLEDDMMAFFGGILTEIVSMAAGQLCATTKHALLGSLSKMYPDGFSPLSLKKGTTSSEEDVILDVLRMMMAPNISAPNPKDASFQTLQVNLGVTVEQIGKRVNERFYRDIQKAIFEKDKREWELVEEILETFLLDCGGFATKWLFYPEKGEVTEPVGQRFDECLHETDNPRVRVQAIRACVWPGLVGANGDCIIKAKVA